MRSFAYASARDVQDAVERARQASGSGREVAFSGGGSDLLVLVKERLVDPDVVIGLSAIRNLDQVTPNAEGTTIGGLITLDALSRESRVRDTYTVLAEAAESVATPQIRNVGTLSGNVCQRPWCWYYRNGFPCYKAGGNQCFSFAGENQFHAIFGGGPSYIVHPSDTAPALVALGATFRIVGPDGERTVAASDYFVLPRRNPAQENVLSTNEVLASVHLPRVEPGTRSAYHKVMDREVWTHAVVSAAVVLRIERDVCRSASIVLGGVAPVPWRVPEAEQVLVGQRITEALAEQAGEASVLNARPLSKNGYKVPLTKKVVARTVLQVAGL